MRGARGSSVLATAMALAAVAWLVFVGPASGATLEVTSADETGPGSLGAQILKASDGDTIQLGPGEYVLVNGDYLVAKGLTLRGEGVDATTIIPSGGGDALLDEHVRVVDAEVGPALQGDGEGEDGDEGKIETKAQIIALIGTLAFFLMILELVRRRRLVERYALLWMSAAIALLVLAIWTGGLEVISDAMGIEEPANAIFILAFGVAFLLLLNFSVATSRLSEETKILAQETARLEQELRAARGEVPTANGASAEAEAGAPPPAGEPAGSEPPADT